VSVFRVQSGGEVEVADMDAFVRDADSVSFMLFLRLGQTRAVMRVGAYSVDVAISEYQYMVKFLADLRSSVFSQLKDGMIEVRGNQNIMISPASDITSSIRLSEFTAPELYDKIIFDQLYPAVAQAIEKNIKTGILLYGDYGVSKSTTANKVMGSVEALKMTVTNGGYGYAISVAESIKAAKIVLIDDVDTDLNDKKTSDVTDLLRFLDSDSYSVVILIANNPKNICRAVVRPGRCDIKIECKRPGREDILDILAGLDNLFPGHQYDKELCVSEFIKLKATHASINASYKNMIRYGKTLLDAITDTNSMDSQASEYLVE
jgi:hypothetical protein